MSTQHIEKINNIRALRAPWVAHVSKRIDHVGAGMSFACALHCIALPFLIGVLPLVGLEFLLDHTAERIFVACSIALALLSLCWGYRSHKSGKALGILLLSVAILVLGIMLSDSAQHTTLVVCGAFGISASHLLNQRLCKSCKECH